MSNPIVFAVYVNSLPSMSAKETKQIQLQAVVDKYTQEELPKNILIEVKWG